MEKDYFKEHLFDLINESDLLNVQDIQPNLQADGFLVTVHDGSTFNIPCFLMDQSQTNRE